MSVPTPITRAVDLALEGTVGLSFSRIGHEVRSRLDDWQDLEELPGDGRRVLVTGANSGLGYAAACLLLFAGAQVRLLVRSTDKGEDTLRRLAEDVGRDLDEDASFDVADLADLASVRAFADRQVERHERLDAVIHNAGALFAERAVTQDGLERTYQIHVVAPFLLTSLLLPHLTEGPPSRVITVTSGGMYAEKLVTGRVDSPGEYRGTVAYARAKRAQVVLTREWARRLGGRGVGFHVAHPGWALTPGVESSLPGFRRLTGPVLRTPEQGADTIVWLALTEPAPDDGRLWHDRRPRLDHKVPWTRSDREEADRLWDRVSRDADIDPLAAAPGDSSTTA